MPNVFLRLFSFLFSILLLRSYFESGSLPMHQLISLEAVQEDCAIHAELCAVHLSPDADMAPMLSYTSHNSQTDARQAPATPSSFLTHPHVASTFLPFARAAAAPAAAAEKALTVAAKETVARCLISFFPTRGCKMKTISGHRTLCPFWEAASNSISLLCQELLASSSVHSHSVSQSRRYKNAGPVQLSSQSGNDKQRDCTSSDVSNDCSSHAWNVLHLSVRSGRLDVLRYLLNIQQEEKDRDLGSVIRNQERNSWSGNAGSSQRIGQTAGCFQFMKGRRVPVDKVSLCQCACYYDQPLSLAILEGYSGGKKKQPISGYFGAYTGPSGRSQASFSLPDDPCGPLKIFKKTYFKPILSDISIFELCLFAGLKCRRFLLEKYFSENFEPDFVWPILVECLQRGFLSENNLVFVIKYLFKNIENMEFELMRKNKMKSISKNILSYETKASEYRNTIKLLINRVDISSSLSTPSNKDSEEKLKESFFQLSCRRGLASVVQLLLLYGADVFGTDTEVLCIGAYPLLHAVNQTFLVDDLKCCIFNSLLYYYLHLLSIHPSIDPFLTNPPPPPPPASSFYIYIQGMAPWRIVLSGGHSHVTRLLGSALPLNGEVHTAARTIAGSIRQYLLRSHSQFSTNARTRSQPLFSVGTWGQTRNFNKN